MTNIVYSFDPGKVTGVVSADTLGNVTSTEQYEEGELWDFLDTIKEAHTFIIEGFRIRPDKAQSFIYSDLQVLQVLGSIRYCAHRINAEVVIQSPTVKSIGYKWAGLQPPKNHDISHSTDAYAHLSYWWVKNCNLQPIIMRRLANGKEK
jgi:hypothetical protein